MKKKIVTILLFFTIISTVGYQVSGAEQIRKDAVISSDFRIDDNLKLKTDEITSTSGIHQKIYTSSYNDNIISMIQQLNETMVLRYIENLTAFGPRVTSSPACDDAGKYIYNEFKNMGLDVRYQNWSAHAQRGSNIEASINGINSSSDEIYIICGHYDSVTQSPGADDNGAGTTAVISAAKIMSQYSFNHTIRFVTFSGEEQGLYGSRAYAEEAFENDDNIIAAINMDMMGYSKDVDDKVKVYYNDYFEWLMDFTINVSQQYDQYIHMEAIPSGSSGGSDHVSFWNEGYNAIFFFEYEWNPYYHSSGDTIEHMSIPYATKVSKLSMAILAELSQISCNSPPHEPETPFGPTNGNAKTEYTYTSSTIDSHGHQVYYMWNWGDGNLSDWFGPYNSGETCEASHIWIEKGDYHIKVKAKDEYDAESNWSDPLSISMPKSKSVNTPLLRFLENHPPNTPNIYGPRYGKAGEYYFYTICSTDPDGDDISYAITWGDGLGTKWLGPIPSGTCFQVNHKWFQQGNYNIKVQARDIYLAESDWAMLEVIMPKLKAVSTPFLQFLENHPYMFPLLQQLLGLQDRETTKTSFLFPSLNSI